MGLDHWWQLLLACMGPQLHFILKSTISHCKLYQATYCSEIYVFWWGNSSKTCRCANFRFYYVSGQFPLQEFDPKVSHLILLFVPWIALYQMQLSYFWAIFQRVLRIQACFPRQFLPHELNKLGIKLGPNSLSLLGLSLLS